MKNRILIILFGIVFSLFLAVIFAVPSYGTEANIILQKDSGADNKVKVFLEVSKEESVSTAQIQLDMQSSKKEDFTKAEIEWGTEISSIAETKKITYDKDKINVYVVSKNELGNETENGNKRIEIGTLTIQTQNKEQMNITLKATKDSIAMGTIDHQSVAVSNEISTETELVIKAKQNASSGEEGNKPDDEKEPDDIQTGEQQKGDNDNQQRK